MVWCSTILGKKILNEYIGKQSSQLVKVMPSRTSAYLGSSFLALLSVNSPTIDHSTHHQPLPVLLNFPSPRRVRSCRTRSLRRYPRRIGRQEGCLHHPRAQLILVR